MVHDLKEPKIIRYKLGLDVRKSKEGCPYTFLEPALVRACETIAQEN